MTLWNIVVILSGPQTQSGRKTISVLGGQDHFTIPYAEVQQLVCSAI